MNRRETLRLLGSGLGVITISFGCQTQQDGKTFDSGLANNDTWWDTGDTGLNIDTGTADTGDITDTVDTDSLADIGPELNPRVPRSVLDGGEPDIDLDLIVLSGNYPADIAGHIFVVHPQPQSHGPPVVAGEGVLTRIDLTDSPRLKRRLLKPPCYYLDLALQGHEQEFDYADLTRVSFTIGQRSLLNTGLVAMNDRLIVTTDAGRPWEVDPDTLELATPIGSYDEWQMALPGWISNFIEWPLPLIMSSAHPVFDENTQELFSVNWGMRILNLGGFVNLLRWDGSGQLESFKLVNSWGIPISIAQSVHEIAVTSHHIIIMDTAFLSEMEDLLGSNGTAMRPQSSETILYVIERNALPSNGGNIFAKKVTIPRETAHFMADYDTSNGIIRINLGHQCAYDPSEFIQADDICAANGSPVSGDLLGMLVATTDIGQVGQYEINASTGNVVSQNWLPDERLWGGPSLYTYHKNNQKKHDDIWWLSFGISPELRINRVEAAYDDYVWREVPISQLPEDPYPGTIVRLNTITNKIDDAFSFPLGRWASSPTFVPKVNGGANEGYIIATVMSDDTQTANSSGDEFWIFDAQNLEQGPICRLGHSNLTMPLTLHTCFMETASPRTSTYQVDIRGELEARIGELDGDVQSKFHTNVFPYFS